MHHRCNINAAAVTPGRDDSTLRDHPAFSRNITQVHKTRGDVGGLFLRIAFTKHRVYSRDQRVTWGSQRSLDHYTVHASYALSAFSSSMARVLPAIDDLAPRCLPWPRCHVSAAKVICVNGNSVSDPIPSTILTKLCRGRTPWSGPPAGVCNRGHSSKHPGAGLPGIRPHQSVIPPPLRLD